MGRVSSRVCVNQSTQGKPPGQSLNSHAKGKSNLTSMGYQIKWNVINAKIMNTMKLKLEQTIREDGAIIGKFENPAGGCKPNNPSALQARQALDGGPSSGVGNNLGGTNVLSKDLCNWLPKGNLVLTKMWAPRVVHTRQPKLKVLMPVHPDYSIGNNGAQGNRHRHSKANTPSHIRGLNMTKLTCNCTLLPQSSTPPLLAADPLTRTLGSNRALEVGGRSPGQLFTGTLGLLCPSSAATIEKPTYKRIPVIAICVDQAPADFLVDPNKISVGEFMFLANLTVTKAK
ncbi:hypothetical protein KEM48_006324 [Puccinia striiformis f. sp. tritici PST-130]|nr:hypothetical protein KEM48_006324 [Puccinia striiformis f. sp. tritici PST-130]